MNKDNCSMCDAYQNEAISACCPYHDEAEDTKNEFWDGDVGSDYNAYELASIERIY